MTIEPAVLEDVLASLDVTLGAIRRATLASGERTVLAAGTVVLVYVVEGEVTALAPEGTACALDVCAGDAVAASVPRTLLAGDALLTFGRRTATLASVSGARLTVVEVQLDTASCPSSLPGLVFASGFARLEPAAAALAATLGPAYDGSARSGDPVICRLMVRTVLLSVVRAWAFGDASSVPPVTGDVYLDRVAAAVAGEPGREWTVDQLASVGAMSRTVLTERFRAAFGRTPAGYVTEVRMRRAKELLEAGRSVSEASRALGYSSDDGFSRAFRRHVGVVPSQWRTARRAA
ncbi:helix-turn-helix domain-containing protein [Rathayibacter sp. VKM Ac-2759]|uniref:helix-turn-helix transcriptional regulator n=1 Tax=Rathayibacter sp. VKM Ac-2759 TaxID=2609252 RepID=UPI0013174F10|nr:AraC family transcriptional regulator [Rathayibacter sp. VKM Ac-2759]QHC67357.1 helix-turn-helix domain-containing protein [Rathayibacter sp. VKM Ac-2759]